MNKLHCTIFIHLQVKSFSLSKPTAPSILTYGENSRSSTESTITMSVLNFQDFNDSRLERTIEKLNEDRHSQTFKLNLLRQQSSQTSTENQTFGEIEDQLFNVSHKIYELGERRKERLKVKVNAPGHDQDQAEVDVCKELKNALSLATQLEVIGEDVIRLKFKLDEVSKESATEQKETLQTVNCLLPAT